MENLLEIELNDEPAGSAPCGDELQLSTGENSLEKKMGNEVEDGSI